jgi:hypothetical protein
MHVLPSKRHPGDGAGAGAGGGAEGGPGGFKAARDAQRKADAGNRAAWNSLFMRADTVAEAVAAHYGVTKAQLLDREAADLPVRMALGEAQVGRGAALGAGGGARPKRTARAGARRVSASRAPGARASPTRPPSVPHPACAPRPRSLTGHCPNEASAGRGGRQCDAAGGGGGGRWQGSGVQVSACLAFAGTQHARRRRMQPCVERPACTYPATIAPTLSVCRAGEE